MKLSKQLDLYKKQDKVVLKHFSKNETTPFKVAEFSAVSGVPLVVIYYILQKELDIDFKCDIIRLSEFYNLDIDIEL